MSSAEPKVKPHLELTMNIRNKHAIIPPAACPHKLFADCTLKDACDCILSSDNAWRGTGHSGDCIHSGRSLLRR